MSSSSSNGGSFNLHPPPSPILPAHDPAPRAAYITQHNYATPSNYKYQPQSYLLNSLLHPVAPQFGAENSFGAPEITPEDITFDLLSDRIGKGSYGTVYRAKCRGQEVAVKIPHQQNISDADLQTFQEEVKLMSKLSHPNTIRLMGACTVPGKLQIVTERCIGDLEGLLKDESYHGTLYERLKMARDTAKGMAWLHDVTKIIHGDLKPANLLIDSNNQVKITDFGFSQFKRDHPVTNATTKGTLIWMAPEKIQRQPFTEKVDVFSFGIILWEIVTRDKPYVHHHDPTTFCRAVCYQKERPPLDNVPEPIQHLILACWDEDPSQRWSFREILCGLNSVLVDLVVVIPPAALFWKNKFLLRENFEVVEWPVFRKALQEEITHRGTETFDDHFFDFMQHYLVETIKEGGKDQEVVTMSRFDKVTKWFGPFFMPDIGAAIISEVNNLSVQPWFHGDISYDIANTCLAGKARGTFLIRLSSTDPLNAPFSLSITPKTHIHMNRTNEGLRVQNDLYQSLEHFVHKNAAQLKYPCEKHTERNYEESGEEWWEGKVGKTDIEGKYADLQPSAPKTENFTELVKEAWAQYLQRTEDWRKHKELSDLTGFKDEICSQITKMQDILIAESDSIAVLAQLCRETTTITDRKLPEKLYKYLRSEWLCASLHQVVNEGCTTYTKAAKLMTNVEKIQSKASNIVNEMLGGHLHCIYLKDFSMEFNKIAQQAIPLTTEIEKDFVIFTTLMQELSEAIIADANKYQPVCNALITGLEAMDKVTQLWHCVTEWLNILKEVNESILAWYKPFVFDHDIRLALPMTKSYTYMLLISLYLRASNNYRDSCLIALEEMLAFTDIAIQNKKENEICEKCSQWQLAIKSIVECSVQEILKAF